MEAKEDAIIPLILQLAKQWRLLTTEISSRDERFTGVLVHGIDSS